MTKVVLFFCSFSFFWVSCAPENPSTTQEDSSAFVSNSVVKPPLPQADKSFIVQSIDASQGGVLDYPSGSFIEFPAEAFLDQNNQPVTGQVDVYFKEFNSPISFFASGIPMSYDSAGVNYTFESMGMIEIKAVQNGQELQVNPNREPTINLASKVNNGANNVYQLDTVSGAWSYQSNTAVTQPSMGTSPIDQPILTEAQEVEMVLPRKASMDKPSLKIKIEPGSLPELEAYDNLRFEIAEESYQDALKKSEVLWEDIQVTATEEPGTYELVFIKNTPPKDQAIYKAYPVLEEEEFIKVIASYEEKKKATEEKRARELAAISKQQKDYEKEQDSLAKFNARIQAYNERLKRQNDSILAENVRIEAKNKKIVEKNKARLARRDSLRKAMALYQAQIEKENKRFQQKQDSLNTIRNQEYEAMNAKQKELEAMRADNYEMVSKLERRDNAVYSTFQLSQFGIWNCDNPNLIDGTRYYVQLLDENGDQFLFKSFNVLYMGFNGLKVETDYLTILNSEMNLLCAGTDDFYHAKYSSILQSLQEQSSDTLHITMTKIEDPQSFIELCQTTQLTDQQAFN